jgi:hypothetical protein
MVDNYSVHAQTREVKSLATKKKRPVDLIEYFYISHSLPSVFAI